MRSKITRIQYTNINKTIKCRFYVDGTAYYKFNPLETDECGDNVNGPIINYYH